MEHPILCQQRGVYIQQFVENLDVGNPRMLGCQKYKLDRLLTKALAELPYERGVLTNTFIDDDSFYAGHDRTRPLLQRQRVIHRTTLAVILHRRLRRYDTASLAAFTGRALMIFRAGFALNIVGSFVNGLMPFRRLCGGLLDDNEFGESGHKEGSRFLEFLVAYLGERLDDAHDVLPRHIVWMLLSDFLNEFRLRHQLGHVSSSVLPNQPVTTLARSLRWRELGGSPHCSNL